MKEQIVANVREEGTVARESIRILANKYLLRIRVLCLLYETFRNFISAVTRHDCDNRRLFFDVLMMTAMTVMSDCSHALIKFRGISRDTRDMAKIA